MEGNRTASNNWKLTARKIIVYQFIKIINLCFPGKELLEWKPYTMWICLSGVKTSVAEGLRVSSFKNHVGFNDFLGYDAAALGNQFPTFRRNVEPRSLRIMLDSMTLGYDAAALGNQFPTFRRNVEPRSLRIMLDSMTLGYDAAALGNQFPTFRRNVKPRSLRVEGCEKNIWRWRQYVHSKYRGPITQQSNGIFQTNVILKQMAVKT